jgi:hypothetical protein
MRFIVLAAALLLTASAAQAIPLSAANEEIDVCMRAAATTDHVALKEVDKGACECATKDLHQSLRPSDFDLHERMLETIADGADKPTFDKKMSDIMSARGMNQSDVDAFLARSKSAEAKAQQDCNSSPLLTPQGMENTGH